VDALAVVEAFTLMQDVINQHYSQVIVDYPARIESTDLPPFVMGCYGPGCFAESDWDNVLKAYTQQAAPSFTVYVSPQIAYNHSLLVWVLAHELTHHVFLLNGISIKSQHSLMCQLDRIYAQRLGLPTTNMHAGCN
jgi:hypothetical protein